MEGSIPLARSIMLFLLLFGIGTALTVPLYKFDIKAFISSKLFIKILFWIPIFCVFLIFLYVNSDYRMLVIALLLALAAREAIRQANQKSKKLVISFYYLVFSFALSHFLYFERTYPADFGRIIILLGFASVLSDVVAFFMGNYLGRHKLPASLNPKKSWEGVAGQLLGALLGTILVSRFIGFTFSYWLFLPIGVGSAVGDLLNSFVKRKLRIKDWGNSIPGHGGYLDRLSSLGMAAAFTYYFLLLQRL